MMLFNSLCARTKLSLNRAEKWETVGRKRESEKDEYKNAKQSLKNIYAFA